MSRSEYSCLTREYHRHPAQFHGRRLQWFTSYIKGIIQCAIINGQTSEWASSVKSGMPQGSVLGPLLFLVYINDIVNVVQNCNIRLFADDTCLCFY